MGDVVMVAMIVAFFGLAVALVRGCDSMIGPDPDLGQDSGRTPEHADTSTVTP